MSGRDTFVDVAADIKATGRVVLCVQRSLLAQANDITTLSVLAERILVRLRDEVAGCDAEARAASVIELISNIELLTRSQASSLDLIATRLSGVARRVQKLSARSAPTASRENNVIPFCRPSTVGRQAQWIGREVDKSHQELRSIRESAEEQGALTRVTRDRLRSVRLYLEAISLTSGGPPTASDPVRSAVP